MTYETCLKPRQKKILAAAIAVFSRKGFHQTTMEEIEPVRGCYMDFMADQLKVGQAQGYLRPVDFKLAAVGLVENLCAYHLKNPGKAGPWASSTVRRYASPHRRPHEEECPPGPRAEKSRKAGSSR